EHDWKGRGKTVAVRVNGIDTHYMYRDVVDVVEQAGHRLDVVLVPKVGVPADVYLVDALLTQIEAARSIPHRIGIEVLIETALGYEGKWAIHPSQVALANDVFTPPPAEVERARRILSALDDAARAGRGAAQLYGRMIDAASARMARNIVDIAAAIRSSPLTPSPRRRG